MALFLGLLWVQLILQRAAEGSFRSRYESQIFPLTLMWSSGSFKLGHCTSFQYKHNNFKRSINLSLSIAHLYQKTSPIPIDTCTFIHFIDHSHYLWKIFLIYTLVQWNISRKKVQWTMFEFVFVPNSSHIVSKHKRSILKKIFYPTNKNTNEINYMDCTPDIIIDHYMTWR